MTEEVVFIRCRQGHEFSAIKLRPETGPVIQNLVCPKCSAGWEQLIANAVEITDNSR
jgi:hypothetical protein